MRAPRKRTGLRIPMDLNTALILEAEKREMSKNALMVKILRNWLKAKKGGKEDE
ncbi:hypothetical protein [Fumia xinanensis]|uniref:Uncharacterized protein n=1 Tax=Fumia xinanensis TaxID=2763659 RepID=A0A926E3J0_9FIRM|nr:hypothetical protein [Fumia xinanensis]MBC8558865.1 hypothetical protein [Fumia xinanensis]